MSEKVTRGLLLPVVFALLCVAAIWGWVSGVDVEERDLYGVWRGEQDTLEFVFRFEPDHTCNLRFRDKETGKETVRDGMFETDFAKRPVPLTIRRIPRVNHPLHTIVELRADGTLWVAPFATRWRLRPIAFDSQQTMELRRVEDLEERD